MELWIVVVLLLLHLHLAACVSLPAPSSVSISSFNMEHTLSFLPGPDTPSSARFTVEIVRLRKKSWKQVAGCSELTAGQTCNLTQAFNDPSESYRARVRAFIANQTSTWIVSAAFHPLLDTVLGPPDVSVSGCGNCLLLRLRFPGEPQQLEMLRNLHSELVFNVRRTRDGAEFRLTRDYKDEMEILYLQPGVEYCVTVSVRNIFKSHSVSSKPHCAFTSPPTPTTSLYVVYGLLGAFCTLGCLFIGLVVYGGQLSFKLLRHPLPRTLSYLPLLVKCRGAAPPNLSDRMSDPQLHIDGSAACLLTDCRPVQPLRSTAEDGGSNCRESDV